MASPRIIPGASSPGGFGEVTQLSAFPMKIAIHKAVAIVTRNDLPP
jgi:hypothetical protein